MDIWAFLILSNFTVCGGVESEFDFLLKEIFKNTERNKGLNSMFEEVGSFQGTAITVIVTE